MGKSIAQQLIDEHLLEGQASPGEEIGLRIDQTLTQDATGTLVMQELEAMDARRVETELSVQYVDHNLLQQDAKNPDDHLFLRSACRRFGLWYSPPGNGVSHPLHMERFGAPGKSLLGSDSHTCAAGALGMLAFGSGGMDLALAMMGKPYYIKMPGIWGVRLSGELPAWVSAKDVILEMLRRFDVDGAVDKIIEYYGPGLSQLSTMDRHVIANMGAELGATTTVFPSDEVTRRFMKTQGRADAWRELKVENADYDEHEEINLSELEPLIACPNSPGNVVPVREVAGRDIYQAYIGSSANPGLRDFAIAAEIVADRQVCDGVSFDINPTSRQILENMIELGYLGKLIHAGARLHQAGCNGCIGMGQAPASDRISLRTVPRNFPGRSGTKDDQVYLCSPETAAASALCGIITDPRELDFEYLQFQEPEEILLNTEMLVAPAPEGPPVALEKGPNIKKLPRLEGLPDTLTGPVLLKTGDDISTDEILPAGSRVLPYRSNIEKLSEFTFVGVDENFVKRALKHQKEGFFLIGGENYGQGSSREHAALAPRYLGLRVVIAKSFARIHWQNLINFGILPLTFTDPTDWEKVEQDDALNFTGLHQSLKNNSDTLQITNQTKNESFKVKYNLSKRQRNIILAGSLINVMRKEMRKEKNRH